MSTAITVLLAFTALTIALAVIYVGYRTALVLSRRAPANSWTQGAPSHEDPAWVIRFQNAHLNCLENLPLYAAVVLGAYVSGQLSLLEGLAWIYFGARVAQVLIHVISTSPTFVFLRANVWFVQLAILAYWIYALLAA